MNEHSEERNIEAVKEKYCQSWGKEVIKTKLAKQHTCQCMFQKSSCMDAMELIKYCKGKSPLELTEKKLLSISEGILQLHWRLLGFHYWFQKYEGQVLILIY